MALSSHVVTALAFLNYTSTGDATSMRKILADNFLDQVRPLSLKVPDLTTEPFLARMASNKIRFGINPPKPGDILEDKNRVTIWTNSNGTSEFGFPWFTEYVFRLTFEKDKVVNNLEWVDSLLVSETLNKDEIVREAKIVC
ncbi:hypothetical protein DXG01_004100 [Tephrocybe rancida]|nr:hypothetical protein DXG01_004100 [Tephrocybe rancida]